MIIASDLYLQYGDRILLNHVSFTIGVRDKIGLVGRNGAGKSTLLKLISKETSADSGHITIPPGATIGFLHQDMDIPTGKTVMEECLTAFAEMQRVEARLEEIGKELEERTDYETDSYAQLLEELATLNDKFALFGGVTMEAEAGKVLTGLGFAKTDYHRLTTEFSGGWQMRIELAKMLLQRPDYLLLDEPTNHLDIESILWLEQWLTTYHGAVVTISHDRTFLDNVTKRTLEVELGKVYDYKASYSKFVALQAERREKTEAAFINQQRVLADKQRTINRFMAKATKTKMAQSMQKQLDKIERIEMDESDNAVMNLRFPPAPRSGAVVLKGDEVFKSYGELKVLQGVDVKVDRGERVAFVGQNGQGKTTLAKILIGNIPATAGEIELGHNVSIGYYAQDQSDALNGKLTLLETMENHSPPEMRTRLRNILGAFLFSGEDQDKKVSVLSGGERARLAMACMLLRPFNLLVLDEPTNHLDMASKDILKQALLDYDGTLVVVSHDREFLTDLTDRTLEFRDHQLFEHLGDVNTFLEKRRLDNMRAVELEKSKSLGEGTPAPSVGAKTQVVKKSNLSPEERKNLEREVRNTERKIEKLEKDIKRLLAKMGEAGFYESADAQKTLDQHKAKEAELEVAMERWEETQSRLEA
ncbi:MAG: ABC-F family ATP-binding cassette domain-containing protein [Bacteroidota bacterium]